MDFDPQTVGQPLVIVQRSTTKVNLVMIAAVIVFLFIGLAYVGRAVGKADRGEPVREPAAPTK